MMSAPVGSNAAFIVLRCIPLAIFAEGFYHKRMLISSRAFSVYFNNHMILSFILLMYYITVIDL